MPHLKPARLTAEDLERLANEERDRFRRYATGGNEPRFALILRALYREWDTYNASYFSAVLRPPHITCGPVPPACWGVYSSWTDWGGRVQVTLKASYVWGTAKVIINPLPARGTMRFIADILLHETVHQWQHEIAKKPENSYGGHGTAYAQKCNEIGAILGLPPVAAKRRKNKTDRPSCAQWPHNVRPPDYYSPDVDIDRLLKKKPKHEPDIIQVFRTILEMLDEGRVDKVKRMLRAEIRRAEGPVPKPPPVQTKLDTPSTRGEHT